MWKKLPDNGEGRIFNTVSIGNDNTIAGTTRQIQESGMFIFMMEKVKNGI